MSIRTDRVGETIREVVAEAIRNLADPGLEVVSITGCDVTADLAYARVFFSTLHDDDAERAGAQGALDRARGRLQAQVARSLHTRRTPKLSFHVDESIVQGDRIEQILASLDIPDETPPGTGDFDDESSDV